MFLNYPHKKPEAEIFTQIPDCELEIIQTKESKNLLIQGDNLLILKQLNKN